MTREEKARKLIQRAIAGQCIRPASPCEHGNTSEPCETCHASAHAHSAPFRALGTIAEWRHLAGAGGAVIVRLHCYTCGKGAALYVTAAAVGLYPGDAVEAGRVMARDALRKVCPHAPPPL